MREQGIALTPRELFFKKVAFGEGSVTQAQIQALPRPDQEIVYRLANTYAQLDVIRTMRALGFNRTEELFMSEGPSIFGYNMDVLEMYERLRDFLRQLRSQGLLLSETEFARLPAANFLRDPHNISCILGKDYIERKARKLGLRHIKVPKIITVVPDEGLTLQIHESQRLAFWSPCQMRSTTHVARVRSVNRQLTPEEVDELLRLFEAVGYDAINWHFGTGSIFIGEDGIYITDTECFYFWGERTAYRLRQGDQFKDMMDFVRAALPPQAQRPFLARLEEKHRGYCAQEATLNNEQEHRAAAESTALTRTGCINNPTFTFTRQELLT